MEKKAKDCRPRRTQINSITPLVSAAVRFGDPAFHLNVDPDPAFHLNVDPDLDPVF